MSLLKNYFLSLTRNALRDKFYFLLNLLGLAVGITCAPIIIRGLSAIVFEKLLCDVKPMDPVSIAVTVMIVRVAAPRRVGPDRRSNRWAIMQHHCLLLLYSAVHRYSLTWREQPRHVHRVE